MISIVPVLSGCSEMFGYAIEVGPPLYNAWETNRRPKNIREGKGRRYF